LNFLLLKSTTRYLNQIDFLRSYMDANGYLSNLKILYKFYKGLWHEIKITQKCGLQQSREWIFIFNLFFFIECCTIFFTELLNIEAKWSLLPCIFVWILLHVIDLGKVCKKFSDLTGIHLCPYISIKNQLALPISKEISSFF